jgi:hypothetical protein
MPTYTYVPVIKGKLNDLKAFFQVGPSVKSSVKPLVEIVPVPNDSTADKHLEKFVHNLSKFVSGRDFFVDLYGFMPGETLDDGVDATIGGLRILRGKGLLATPTYGFDRDDSLWSSLRTETQKTGRGFCFRVDIDDLDDRSEETWQAIIERTAQLHLTPKDIDILIDLRYVGETDTEKLKSLVVDFLSLMPAGQKFRSVILSGSSALKHVGSIPKDATGDVERKELRIWMELQADLFGAHSLIYSDYGIVHPDFSIVGPNKNSNAKIRYTTSGKIKIFRGHRLLDAPGYKQYHALADDVRNSPEYLGAAFSRGDAYVDLCADGNASSGNLGTWVFVDMNHHLELTAKQAQKLTADIDDSFSSEQVEAVMEVL